MYNPFEIVQIWLLLLWKLTGGFASHTHHSHGGSGIKLQTQVPFRKEDKRLYIAVIRSLGHSNCSLFWKLIYKPVQKTSLLLSSRPCFLWVLHYTSSSLTLSRVGIRHLVSQIYTDSSPNSCWCRLEGPVMALAMEHYRFL